ncbi:hypothetical protein NL108_007849, partial [Boleophthalmus pectinirostris]
SSMFDTGLRSDQFIDTTGLYDNTISFGQYSGSVKSGQYDTGLKTSAYDVSVRSGQYDSGVKAGTYSGSLASGQFDTMNGYKSSQYDMSLKSGHYDLGLKTDHYDSGVKLSQYDIGVKSGHSTIRSAQYDNATVDAALPAFTWSTATLPSQSAPAVSATSYSYQISTNNMGGSVPLSPASPSSLSVYGFQNNLGPTSGSVLTTSGANTSASLGGYGVQKNMSSGAVLGSAVSTGTRSQTEDSYKRFVAADKENFSAKRDGETLILAKDSGKQFTSGSSVHIGGGSLSGDSIKKEKLISSYGETTQLKADLGQSYYGSSGVLMKDKATYA